MSWYQWKPYVPVAVRRSQALNKMQKLRKKGHDIHPVEIQGKKIVTTFWGKAWCDHLESFSDFDNRLPRGRTYVRNGSVCHLEIAKGKINAMVSGSELYNVKVDIKMIDQKKWSDVKNRCAGQIGSILELLQGRLSKNVMTVVTNRDQGMFPLPDEIELECDCPDWAYMCKHIAAVLYGVGARLDKQPQQIFLLRGVDHIDLIDTNADVTAATKSKNNSRKRIATEALTDVFGIEMSEETPPTTKKPTQRRKKTVKKSKKSSTTTKLAVKKKAKSRKKVAPRKAIKPPKKTVQVKKTTTSGKAIKKKKSRISSKARPITGKAVAKLRIKFGMSQSQFAKLLGVSATSIGNWEKSSKTLNLQSWTLAAVNSIKQLTKQQALRKLKRK